MINLPIKNRLVADASIRSKHAEAVSALEVYEATLLLSEDELDPQSHAKRLRMEICSASNPAARRELQVRLSIAEGSGAASAKNAARVAVRAAYAPAETAISGLLSHAIKLANSYLKDALEDEASLFKKWNMAQAQTAVSNSIRQLITELEAFKNRPSELPGFSQSLPAKNHPAVNFLA